MWRYGSNWANQVVSGLLRIKAFTASYLQALPVLVTCPRPETENGKRVHLLCRLPHGRALSPGSCGIIWIQSKTVRHAGCSRCIRCSTASAMSRNCSLADEITSAISPGVCPGAGIAWTPGTISFSVARNSMRALQGGSVFNATINQQFFHVVIHSRAAQVGLGSPEIPFRFDITYWAFANAGLPLVS